MTTKVILLERLDVFDKRPNFMDKEKVGKDLSKPLQYATKSFYIKWGLMLQL